MNPAAGIAVGAAAMLVLTAGATAGVLDLVTGPNCTTTTATGTVAPGPLAHHGVTPVMMGNATTIVHVGQQIRVPARGQVIAVATALQESGLRNLANPAVPESLTLPHQGEETDHDSVGLFQQRPSWGTLKELMDPATSAKKFYNTMLTVPGWQTRPLTDVAQAVQHSAFPDAYARWENLANSIVDTVGPALSTACTTGATMVLARAATWLHAWHGGPVPYLSSNDPAAWLGGYRRDCSGYASMAEGLPGPGLDTAELAARSTAIPKVALAAGDLLINTGTGPTGHVVIFDHWANPIMTAYWGYEQSGDGGTHYRAIPYPYYGGYPMAPYWLSN